MMLSVSEVSIFCRMLLCGMVTADGIALTNGESNTISKSELSGLCSWNVDYVHVY